MSNKNNPFSSYYNYPKAWGEAEPQERWHSDESEKGAIPPWMKKDSDDLFDKQIKEELTKAYKLYEDGEMTNEEFKYIEASFDELRNQKENLINNNATFGVGLTTQEGIERGEPKYKLMVMQDKNPFTKDLPSGDQMMPEDFR